MGLDEKMLEYINSMVALGTPLDEVLLHLGYVKRVRPKDDTTKTVDERIAQFYMAITEVSHDLVTLDKRLTKIEHIKQAETQPEKEDK